MSDTLGDGVAIVYFLCRAAFGHANVIGMPGTGSARSQAFVGSSGLSYEADLGVAVVNGRRFFVFIVFATLLFPAPAMAQIWFVDKDNAGGVENGMSWLTAYGAIQPAIDAASIYGGQVWVAEGVYDEQRIATSGTFPPRPGDKHVTSLVTRAVPLYGGFSGNETLRGQADPETHVTVIDGSKANYGSPDEVTVIGTNLDGFTIRGGGGVGIDVKGPSHTTYLRRLIVEDYPVAGLIGYNGVGLMEDCIIRNNGGPGHPEGGAFAPSFGSSGGPYPIVMRNCLIEGNYGVSRAVWPRESFDQLTEHCIFRGNIAVGDGPLIVVPGTRVDSHITRFRNCLIADNVAPTLLGTNSSKVRFEQCLIVRNEFDIGLDLICESCPSIRQSTIVDNVIGEGGVTYRVTWMDFWHGDYSLDATDSIIWNPAAAAEISARRYDRKTYTYHPVPRPPSTEGALVRGYTGLAAPTFVDMANGDYRPAPGSTAIDIGGPGGFTDFGGDWRSQGAARDAGAYESPGTVSDSDGDGIPDSAEGAPEKDTDRDGTPDYLDTDSDDDGIPDSVEGVGDQDHDLRPNWIDTDSDYDGLTEDVELAIGTDPYNRDSDGDGLLDLHEGQNRDTDGDGVIDPLDSDSDGDGLSDAYEGADSREIVLVYDTEYDRYIFMIDRLPNHRDLDSDNDGVSDSDERINGTFPYDPDYDGDGISDYLESYRVKPSRPGWPDVDDDGDPDFDDDDSDNDGIPDSVETGNDSDGDGIPNFRDLDSDNDGVFDSDEWLAGTNPYGSKMAADVDGSTAVDAVDIQIIINRVLGLNAKHCDVNNDKSVDATDIQWSINAVLGLIG